MLPRLRCLITRHTWTDWSAWTSRGRGHFWRDRHCTRCTAYQTEED